MLKRITVFSCLVLIVGLIEFEALSSKADDCSAAAANGGTYQPISISVSCTTTLDGTDTTDWSIGNSSSSTGCSRSDGTEVACWNGNFWWSPTFNFYCQVATTDLSSPWRDTHLDTTGKPTGTFYQCLLPNSPSGANPQYAIVWADDTPITPGVPGTDPTTLVQEAVVKLGLHAPDVGVGAYTYPGYEDWGLSWWVGAPMWMWTNTTDDLQWGTHDLTNSDGNLTVNATITSTSISFDPGNGDTPAICDTAGTPRPWDPDDPLSHHSPSGCEYTYMTTNTLGDKDSRFVVTATVTWTVTWSSSDGQHGTFTTTTDSTDNPTIHIGELRTVLVAPK